MARAGGCRSTTRCAVCARAPWTIGAANARPAATPPARRRRERAPRGAIDRSRSSSTSGSPSPGWLAPKARTQSAVLAGSRRRGRYADESQRTNAERLMNATAHHCKRSCIQQRMDGFRRADCTPCARGDLKPGHVPLPSAQAPARAEESHARVLPQGDSRPAPSIPPHRRASLSRLHAVGRCRWSMTVRRRRGRWLSRVFGRSYCRCSVSTCVSPVVGRAGEPRRP